MKAGLIKNLPLEENETFSITPGVTSSYDLTSFKDCLQAFSDLNFSTEHTQKIFLVSLHN